MTATNNPQTNGAVLNDAWRASLRFYFAQKVFRGFTLVWLYWNVAKYQQLLERPLSLFSPDQMMAWLAVPSFPGQAVFYTVAGLVALANGWQLIYRKTGPLQLVVAVGLLWMNLVPWSYGFQSHVNHLFLLAHLFLVFVSVEKPSLNTTPLVEQGQALAWFYRGLLFTYTLAGLWKIPSLAYKVLTNSPDVHWLHPEAALYNARVSFMEYDLPMPSLPLWEAFPWAWQIGFILVVYIQATAVLSAGRAPLRPWMGAAFILFHLINQFAFLIFFVVGCFTLFILFFPYEAIIPHFRTQGKAALPGTFSGSKLEARFSRKYPIFGVTDTYAGFEAYRQKILLKNYYLFGVLYLPGLRTSVETWWKVQRLIWPQNSQTRT